jgi:hypothetical protein
MAQDAPDSTDLRLTTWHESTEASPSPRQSDWIGPYRIVRWIGEGGMGEVYEAEQEQPIRRVVALKIISGYPTMTLQQWLDQWDRKGPEVRQRVHVALDFLRRHYGAGRDDRVLSEIRCIDFSRPVELPSLPAGTALVGSKDPRVSPYRAVYFTKSGHPVQRLGVSSAGSLRTSPKVMDKTLYRYEVIVTIPVGEVLQSVCAPAADTWSLPGQKVLADGGGLQYLIPNMNRYLRYVA